ncbi:MAG: hypothetical protein LQ340_002406 [Diploschistes diacapsis]|nr:MAG: hypothetical protein LQ340_002406 [Diploschistes diacapsis]
MPGDHFFGGMGGVGVDMLYPSGLGINNTFSEPEWNPSNIAPLPADFDTTFTEPAHHHRHPSSTGARPPPIEVSAVPPHMVHIPRPKSSPSTFGPNVEDLLFPGDPYKFTKNDDFTNFPTFPLSPAKTNSPYFGGHEYSISARNSPARHAPIPIAPDPVGLRQLNALKRMRDDEDHYAEYGQRKRKRAVSNAGPVELNEEETLLLKLKEEENLPWKDIAVRFQTDLGKTYQVPALQMRFKRLRERMRTWTEVDVSLTPSNPRICVG